MKWKTNLGERPGGTKGKSVRVKLRNGMMPEKPWPADGRFGCCWALDGSAFDIVEYALA